MKKKIRVLLPKLVIETLESDAEHFNFSRERLCNEVILKMGYKPKIYLNREIQFDDKEYLQFTLNQISQKIYSDILNKTEDKNESEIVRSILNTYVNYHPFVREYIIFKETITFIEDIFKSKQHIIVSIDDKVIEGKIRRIERCKNSNFRKVHIENTEEYLSKIKIIS